jgi:hypothetical protein
MPVENSQVAGLVLSAIFAILCVGLFVWMRIKYPRRKGTVVDPVAEAEVYVAYGRKDQAIQVLEKAHLANPNRIEIQKKLDELRGK